MPDRPIADRSTPVAPIATPPAECRYCGITPDQDFPRPSYHDMSAEVTRLRETLDEAVRLLNKWVTHSRSLCECDACAFFAALTEGSDVLPTQRDH